MMQSLEEKIILLEQFDSALERWFNGKVDYDGKDSLRKSLNELAPMARAIIKETRCCKLISVSPPSAIGGPVLQNVDPIDMLFNNYYGMSFIPTIRDMTQQAVGVLRRGGLDDAKEEHQKEETVANEELVVPEKVTFDWLFRHVPVKWWLLAAGVLFAAFTLGIKASTWSFVKEILG